MKWIVTCVLIMFFFLGNSQVMNIGILHTHKVKSVQFDYNESSYEIIADGANIGRIEYGGSARITLSNGKLQLKVKDEIIGSYANNCESSKPRELPFRSY